MDGQLLRAYREHWQAVADVEAQERRAASVALRWQQLNAILRMSSALGLGPMLRARTADEQIVRTRWARLKPPQP